MTLGKKALKIIAALGRTDNTLQEIADNFGVSKAYVEKLAKEANIKRRGNRNVAMVKCARPECKIMVMPPKKHCSRTCSNIMKWRDYRNEKVS